MLEVLQFFYNITLYLMDTKLYFNLATLCKPQRYYFKNTLQTERVVFATKREQSIRAY